jgi:hypothetical protein
MHSIGELANCGINVELMAVGTTGEQFNNTAELRPMKYEEAMALPSWAEWEESVDAEHERFKKHKVWRPVLRSEIPPEAKVLSSTWAMKQKADGTKRARLNARGYEQVDGEHFKADDIAAPVVNTMTIRICFVLLAMTAWYAHLMDVQGAFLTGEFGNGERLYMDVPKGFERYYDAAKYVLLLLKTIYGLRQSAKRFWLRILEVVRFLEYVKSQADPCLYFKWTNDGLCLWLSWVDDCLMIGPKNQVMKTREGILEQFECDDVGEMKEYVGCKIERGDGYLKVTQPVLMRSLQDEFELPEGNPPLTPAPANTDLPYCKPEDKLPDKLMTYYRSGVGKLIHLVRWTRPECWNPVRDLTRYMTAANGAHITAMHRVMKYLVSTKEKGLYIEPTKRWDGKDRNFEFEIGGEADSNYASAHDRKSTSGWRTYLCGASVSEKSSTQRNTTLSVTEAELVAGTDCAQDMLYIKKILESMGLKVKLPMILKIDNKGFVDFTKSWTTAGRMRHIDCRYYFLRELREAGIIVVEWIDTTRNTSDLFTKNTDKETFMKHSSTLIR